MNRITRMQLKRTHGKNGLPELPAYEDPDELDTPDVAGLVADMVSPMVDDTRSITYLLMLDSLYRATRT